MITDPCPHGNIRCEACSNIMSAVISYNESAYDFSKEEESHPNLKIMTDDEKVRERFRNLLSPIITYFEIKDDVDFLKLPGSEKIILDLNDQCKKSLKSLRIILKEKES